jgi:predicted flap endonuclease-1-like 5' DNA nuclease
METAAFTEFTTATGEILVILAGAFVLGWIARWVYELVVYAPLGVEDYGDDHRTTTDETTICANEDQVLGGEAKQAPASIPAQREAQSPRAQEVPAQDPIVGTQAPVMPYKQDDLKMVEGIGPKIAELLQNGGITTWQELATTDPEDIKTILRAAGERYRIHDPTTWPEQAQLAVEHKWEELEEYQGALSGGKDLTRIYKQTTD